MFLFHLHDFKASIANWLWSHIALDFVTDLPVGHTAILVILCSPGCESAAPAVVSPIQYSVGSGSPIYFAREIMSGRKHTPTSAVQFVDLWNRQTDAGGKPLLYLKYKDSFVFLDILIASLLFMRNMRCHFMTPSETIYDDMTMF